MQFPKGTQSEGKRRVGTRLKSPQSEAGIRQRLLTSGKKIVLYNLGRDKYFRLLASVKVGDIDASANGVPLGAGSRMLRSI